jgi:integrase
MTAAGKRLWPNGPRMTPYYLRHAFASDLKRGRHIAQDDISAAMGHCVNKTTSYYSQYQIGKSGGVGLTPAAISSARVILRTRYTTPNKQAQK